MLRPKYLHRSRLWDTDIFRIRCHAWRVFHPLCLPLPAALGDVLKSDSMHPPAGLFVELGRVLQPETTLHRHRLFRPSPEGLNDLGTMLPQRQRPRICKSEEGPYIVTKRVIPQDAAYSRTLLSVFAVRKWPRPFGPGNRGFLGADAGNGLDGGFGVLDDLPPYRIYHLLGGRHAFGNGV